MYGYSSYARTINGEVYAWGDNSYGQLGIGNTENQSSPVKIESLSNVDEIYYDGSCCSVYAKMTNGEVYAWGYNSDGQLGIGNTEDQSRPVKIEEYGNTQSIKRFYRSSNKNIILTDDEKIYVWSFVIVPK